MAVNNRHLLLIHTSPFHGCENEFNHWYDHVHLAEVLAVPGFVGARRFVAPQAAGERRRYVAIYEVETDDIVATMERFEKARPAMSTTPALDPSSVTIELLTPVTPLVTPGQPQ
ncbi:DUF4286 family protein [Micromonospora sp. NBRC 110038]|uniref:DUF4286 family protein n=1 Tax=Micromonospora sp. NBRC 110038 TaxID=1550034 RepID=UPI001E3EB81F|nr:DUF4286 family protein [Micromonospora sp. NBRC 110038]